MGKKVLVQAHAYDLPKGGVEWRVPNEKDPKNPTPVFFEVGASGYLEAMVDKKHVDGFFAKHPSQFKVGKDAEANFNFSLMEATQPAEFEERMKVLLARSPTLAQGFLTNAKKQGAVHADLLPTVNKMLATAERAAKGGAPAAPPPPVAEGADAASGAADEKTGDKVVDKLLDLKAAAEANWHKVDDAEDLAGAEACVKEAENLLKEAEKTAKNAVKPYKTRAKTLVREIKTFAGEVAEVRDAWKEGDDEEGGGEDGKGLV